MARSTAADLVGMLQGLHQNRPVLHFCSSCLLLGPQHVTYANYILGHWPICMQREFGEMPPCPIGESMLSPLCERVLPGQCMAPALWQVDHLMLGGWGWGVCLSLSSARTLLSSPYHCTSCMAEISSSFFQIPLGTSDTVAGTQAFVSGYKRFLIAKCLTYSLSQ